MTESEANAVYDVLVRECGADDDPEPQHWNSRASFVREFTKDRPTIEYRFHGALGFGGKFYPDMRVTCYPEDETPKRRAMVERANVALREMVKR